MQNDVLSFSISDAACKNMLHYFAKANGISDEVIIKMTEEYGVGLDSEGVHIDRDTALSGLNRLIELIKDSPGHRFRVVKVQSFIETAIEPAKPGDMFYLHITH